MRCDRLSLVGECARRDRRRLRIAAHGFRDCGDLFRRGRALHGAAHGVANFQEAGQCDRGNERRAPAPRLQAAEPCEEKQRAAEPEEIGKANVAAVGDLDLRRSRAVPIHTRAPPRARRRTAQAAQTAFVAKRRSAKEPTR